MKLEKLGAAIICLALTCLATVSTYAEECCGSRPMPQLPKKCCEDQIIDPEKVRKISKEIDISKLFETINKLNDGIESTLNIKAGCKLRMSGPAKISGSVVYNDECCNDKITELQRIIASGSVDSASAECEVPLTGAWCPPQLAGISLLIGGKLSATLNISSVQTCEEPDVCMTFTPQASVSGGLKGYVGQEGYEILNITGKISGNITGPLTYCVESGFTAGPFKVKPCSDVSIKLGGFYTLFSYSNCWGEISS